MTALNSGDIDSCVQDLLDLTDEYKQLEVIIYHSRKKILPNQSFGI